MTAAPPSSPRLWLWVPIALLLLAGVVWLLLANLPFGGSRSSAPPARVEREAAPRAHETGTIVDVTEPRATAPSRQRPPASAPAARPRVAASRSEDLSESEAIAHVASFIRSRDYYHTPADCIDVNSRGFRNRGYTLEVFDSCADGGARSLGQWRIDTKTREIFRQRDDGRFLRP